MSTEIWTTCESRQVRLKRMGSFLTLQAIWQMRRRRSPVCTKKLFVCVIHDFEHALATCTVMCPTVPPGTESPTLTLPVHQINQSQSLAKRAHSRHSKSRFPSTDSLLSSPSFSTESSKPEEIAPEYRPKVLKPASARLDDPLNFKSYRRISCDQRYDD